MHVVELNESDYHAVKAAIEIEHLKGFDKGYNVEALLSVAD